MKAGSQFALMFGAHLKMMFREKAVWFWNIFFPIILMVIFMVIFGGGGSGSFETKVALVKPASGDIADSLEQSVRTIPVFEWESETPVSLDQASEWVKEGDVDAAIVLPESADAGAIRLIVNVENETNATTQAIAGILGQLVQQANLQAAGVERPAVVLEQQSITSGSDELNYVDFLMTGMIGLALAQGGLFGMVDLVEMRRNGLMRRLRMTPMRMGLFGLASMAVRFVLGVVQIAALALIGVFGFGANLHIDVPTLIVVFVVGSLAFNALGYLFSSFSKSIEAYMGMANIASFLMMFISGVFFPTATMPDWLRPVTEIIPLTYFVNGLRDGLVYGSGIATGEFWLGIGVMALWGAAAFVIGAVLYKRMKVAAR